MADATAPDAVSFPAGRVVESGGPLPRWLGRWGMALGAAIPIGLWSVIVLFSPPGHGPPPDPVFATLIATTWLGPLAALLSRNLGRRTMDAREVRVTRDRVFVVRADGNERSWARSDVVAGLDLRGKVALTLRTGATVEIEIGETNASHLLDALQLGATERRAVFRWRRTFDSILGGVAGFAALGALFLAAPSPALGAMVCPIIAGLPWLLAGWLGTTVSERSIEVGADALRVTMRAKTVLARFADLERVEHVETPFGGRLDLVMKDGRRERVLLDPEDRSLRDAVLARIDEARRAAASRPDGQRLAELLQRAGSSFSELRATAARLLDASLGFRDATVTESEVAALLDDPVASAEQRIAAAIALAAQKESGKARVRVAAEACASPKLRVALDAAADGTLDDAMLAEAEAEAGTQKASAST